jgi:hypothetical protein
MAFLLKRKAPFLGQNDEIKSYKIWNMNPKYVKKFEKHLEKKHSTSRSGLPDSLWYNIPKQEKI